MSLPLSRNVHYPMTFTQHGRGGLTRVRELARYVASAPHWKMKNYWFLEEGMGNERCGPLQCSQGGVAEDYDANEDDGEVDTDGEAVRNMKDRKHAPPSAITTTSREPATGCMFRDAMRVSVARHRAAKDAEPGIDV